jgi:hypothetical protein
MKSRANDMKRIYAYMHILRGADKSLAFPVSYFPICSTTKRIFLGWVKELITAPPPQPPTRKRREHKPQTERICML